MERQRLHLKARFLGPLYVNPCSRGEDPNGSATRHVIGPRRNALYKLRVFSVDVNVPVERALNSMDALGESEFAQGVDALVLERRCLRAKVGQVGTLHVPKIWLAVPHKDGGRNPKRHE